jgi:hypothetical protein
MEDFLLGKYNDKKISLNNINKVNRHNIIYEIESEPVTK